MIGEKMHDATIGHYKVCSYCHIQHDNPDDLNRTFTTDSDMMAVRKALRKKGLWDKFCSFAWNIFSNGTVPIMSYFLAYLDENPERHNWFVASFLGEVK